MRRIGMIRPGRQSALECESCHAKGPHTHLPILLPTSECGCTALHFCRAHATMQALKVVARFGQTAEALTCRDVWLVQINGTQFRLCLTCVREIEHGRNDRG